MTNDVPSRRKDSALDKRREVKTSVHEGKRSKTPLELVLEDQRRAAALRMSGPDILTGYTYDSHNYQNRLNNLRKRSFWMRSSGEEDTREKIIEDMNRKFKDIFRKLNILSQEKDVPAVLGCDSKIFIKMIKAHEGYFDRYKNEALSKNLLIRDRAFDRMLARLDMLEMYKRKLEGRKANEEIEENRDNKDQTDNEELEEDDIPEKVGLKKKLLYLVYKSLENNYEAYNRTVKKDISLDVRSYLRDWYRAFLIISDETSRNMKQIFRMVFVPDVGRLLPERETIEGCVQKALETSGASHQKAQELAKDYTSAIYQYNKKKKLLEHVITIDGKNIQEMHHNKSDELLAFKSFDEETYNEIVYLFGNKEINNTWIKRDSMIYKQFKRNDVLSASSDLVKESKRVMKLGKQIRDIVNIEPFRLAATDRQ